jgi:hypothetical protein
MKRVVCNVVMFVLAIVAVLPVVLAIETTINVNTIAYHKVSVFVYGEGEMSILDSHHIESEADGIVSVVHNSGAKVIDVRVKISKDGNTVANEKFEGYSAGENINILIDGIKVDGDYSPEEELLIANESEESEINDLEQNVTNDLIVENQLADIDEENTGEVTGNVIGTEKNNNSSSYVFYIVIVGVFLSLVIILMVVKRIVRKAHLGHAAVPSSVFKNELNNTDDSELKKTKIEKESEVEGVGSESYVEKLEQQIKQVQGEIKLIKNQEKIKAIQKKLEEDREQLERLKRGED